MYHFETFDYKTNKQILIEDEDLKVILGMILNHENGKHSNTEDSNVIFEDAISTKLLVITEKYLKIALGITKTRKSIKLDTILDQFNKLDLKKVSSITFENKAHNGVMTIWEDDSCSDSISNESEDEYLNQLDNDNASWTAGDDTDEEKLDEQLLKKKAANEKEAKNKKISKPVEKDPIKVLKDENKRLKDQIVILKSFVDTYRRMSLKINKEVENVIKII
jgi:hypothetical protein